MAKMYASPQVTKTRLATPYSKSSMPSKEDVEKAANARGMKRHELKGDPYADMNVLPSSGGEVLDRAGIKDNGYLVKKDVPYGLNAMFNTLPPGMDIEDQEIADIREQPYRELVDKSYPNDGWM